MTSIGFVLVRKKETLKLAHYLFTWTAEGNSTKYGKKLIKDGPGMNNFCIVLE
jgi:25S rRNA (adenine2142-N1)-methyltransferase